MSSSEFKAGLKSVVAKGGVKYLLCYCLSSVTMRTSDTRLKLSALLVIFISVFSRDVDAACQQGWDRFQDSCYKHVASRATYPEARGFCEREGYNILTIDSSEENTFMQNLVTNKGGTVWMGITDLFDEGHWVYASRAQDPPGTTKTTVSFTRWYNGEPNNAEEEDCAEFYSTGIWNDCRCDTRLFFVCEAKFHN